jgi:hypothetical protein
MAFIVGYVTKEERKRLEARGWEIEDATDYPQLVGDEDHNLVGTPSDDYECIVVFVDASVFEVMSGPDWETDEEFDIVPNGKTIPTPGPPADVSEAPRDVMTTTPTPLMTEDEFWAIIGTMGWGRKDTNYKRIKNAIRVRLNFDVERIETFHDIYRKKQGDIARVLDKAYYENSDGLGLGDDGFGDLTSHIVGMGKDEYTRVLNDPSLGKARAHAPYGSPEGFTESFSYAVPSKFDMHEIEWSHYVEWAERVQKEYEAAAVHEYAAPIHEACSRIADALDLLTKKEKDRFLAREPQILQDLETIGEFHKRVSLNDLDIENPWAVKNLISDLRDNAPYLR